MHRPTGRSRSWKADKPEVTPRFTASGGPSYHQVVHIGGAEAWASSPKGHGLGVATLHATITPWPLDADAAGIVVHATAG